MASPKSLPVSMLHTATRPILCNICKENRRNDTSTQTTSHTTNHHNRSSRLSFTPSSHGTHRRYLTLPHNHRRRFSPGGRRRCPTRLGYVQKIIQRYTQEVSWWWEEACWVVGRRRDSGRRWSPLSDRWKSSCCSAVVWSSLWLCSGAVWCLLWDGRMKDHTDLDRASAPSCVDFRWIVSLFS